MILHREDFLKIENLIDSDDTIQNVLINFDFFIKDDAVSFDKRFIIIKEDSFFYEIDLNHILDSTLSLPIYDKFIFENKKENYVIDAVLDVLQRRVSEDTFTKIDDNIYEADLDLTYQLLTKTDTLTKIISDTLMAISIVKKIASPLQKLDHNFLSEEQVTDITKELKNYEDLNTDNIHILELASKNIQSILREQKLFNEFNSLFIDEHNYLVLDSNTMSVDELYQFIYTSIKSKNFPILDNAQKIVLEIQRELKYINLYKYENYYSEYLRKDTIEKLYKNMTHNVLKNIEVGDADEFLSLLIDKYLKIQNDLIAIEENIKHIMDEELKLHNNDIDVYEEYLTSNYMNTVYGIDKRGITTQEVFELQFYEAKRSYLKSYYYNNHYKESLLIENYTNTHKIVSKEVEDGLIDKIPTTKLVKGKRKRLTKSDISKMLKSKKREYISEMLESNLHSRTHQQKQLQEIANKYRVSVNDILTLYSNAIENIKLFISDIDSDGLTIEELLNENDDDTIYHQQILLNDSINNSNNKFFEIEEDIIKEQSKFNF